MTENRPSVHTQVTTCLTDSIPRLERFYGNLTPDNPKSYRVFSLNKHSDEYSAAHRVYSEIPDDTSRGRVKVMAECRTQAYFAVNTESRKVRIMSNHCSLRWCPLCSQGKKYHVSGSVRELLGLMRFPKILTLTLKHSDNSLSSQIDHLYDSFARLRKQQLLRSHCFGGIWFFQIKKSKGSGQWHPHLHCLIDGDYMPQTQLSKLWGVVSYGSYIVDIRAIRTVDSTVDYVARYAVNPARLSDYSHKDAVEIVTALHGRRIYGTWGVGKQVVVGYDHKSSVGSWHRIGYWHTVIQLATLDTSADAIIKAWLCDTELPDKCDMSHIEDCPVIVEPIPPPEPMLWD